MTVWTWLVWAVRGGPSGVCIYVWRCQHLIDGGQLPGTTDTVEPGASED
jgi:hypothetical protein